MGAPTSALFAALLGQLARWSWEFWILSIVCILVIGVAYVVIPDPDEKVLVSADKKPTIDYLGAFTSVIGLILINFALN